LKTDIYGFGERFIEKTPLTGNQLKTTEQGVCDMPVNISVKAKLTSIGEITQSLFSKEKG
jgi:hypothetical protein